MKIEVSDDELDTIIDALNFREQGMLEASNELKAERERLDPDEVVKNPNLSIAIERMRDSLKEGRAKVGKLADRLGDIGCDEEPYRGSYRDSGREDFHSDG
jgi:hypothetical protein